jgi:hypothetical protein
MTAESRRRSSWAVWTGVAVVLLPVLYVLSYGPALAWAWQLPEDDPRLVIYVDVYWPMDNLVSYTTVYGPRWVADLLIWHGELWAPEP